LFAPTFSAVTVHAAGTTTKFAAAGPAIASFVAGAGLVVVSGARK
jgi:hypothetical protein